MDVPGDLLEALKGGKLNEAFESLSYSHKKEYVDWIEGAKRDATRQRRIEKALELLAEGRTPKSPKK